MSEPSPLRRTSLHPLILLALGVLLFLPRLGSNGLWDPSEVKVADAARIVAEGRTPPHFNVNQFLIGEGFRTLGTGELGGRLPLALVSILLLLAAYYAGRAILRPRAALIGGIVLGTMPVVLLGARQLNTQAPLLLGVTLAAGGMAHLLWPAEESLGARLFAFVATFVGLALGIAAGGLFQGALGPMIGVTVALLATQPRARGVILAALTTGVAIFAGVLVSRRGIYSQWLEGIPRAPQWQTVVTTAIRPLGFATAPWGALAPFAVLRALDGSQPTPAATPSGRDRFAQVLLPAWLVASYFMGTLSDSLIGDTLPPATVALALLAGAYLDALLENGFASALEGVAVGALALVLAHDVLLTTDAFISVLTPDQIRWPAPITWTANVLFGFLAVFSVVLAAAMALPLIWSNAEDPRLPKSRERLVWGSIGVQVLFIFTMAYWFIPIATQHLSPKELYGKARQLDPKAPLGQYRFTATGASYYMGGRASTTLNTTSDVIAFLKKEERVFIFVGSEELASVDQAARQGAPPVAPRPTPDALEAVVAPPPPPLVSYFVIDDSNSRFLILSNRLTAGEKDLNPLLRFVSNIEPKVKTPLVINFEDKLKLLGYETPAEVDHGGDVKVRLFFQVLAPVGTAYKVFLHFDGPGARVNGDHVPLDGKFPTQFWTPGTYVTDEYLLKPDRSTEPSGVYQLFFGLFSGDKRMKVKEGASDGENRVKLGSVRVR